MTTIKAGSSSTAQKRNHITGIVVSLLDRGRLEAAAKAAGLSVAPDSSDDQASVNLYAHYLKNIGGDSAKLLECSYCFGRSPEHLKECPYCLEIEKTATPASESATKVQHPKEAKTKMNSETTTQVALAVAGGDVIPIKGELMTPEDAKKAQAALAKMTEKDLDKAVATVQTLKGKAAKGMWDLGVEIAKISDGQLWKLRSEDGKPRYKTAEAFVTAELGMSVPHAWALAEISKKFTADEVLKFGTTKLGLILQAPVELRPAIKEKVEAGASKREVVEEVRRANKNRATTTNKRTGKEMPKPKAKTPTADNGKKMLTVANILGSQTLRMYRKASVAGDKKEWVPAKKVADVPFCEMELENDIVQTFTLIEHGDGTLKLKVEVRRIGG